MLSLVLQYQSHQTLNFEKVNVIILSLERNAEISKLQHWIQHYFNYEGIARQKKQYFDYKDELTVEWHDFQKV